MIDSRFRGFWPRRWLRSMAGVALATGVSVGALYAQDVLLIAPPETATKDARKETAPEPRDAPVKEEPKQIEIKKEEAKAAPKQKLITFEFADTRWDDVIRWFVKESGLGFVGTDKPPTGSFSFTPPRGPDGKVKQYTITEVIDILNDAMLAKGYLLMRREGAFTVIPADAQPEPALVRLVTPAALKETGAKEYVKVIVGPLKSISAEDLAPQLKSLMGKFSIATAIPASNQVMLMDQGANLRFVLDFVDSIEQQEGQNETYTRVLKYIKARAAVETLTNIFGNPAETLKNQAQQFTRDRDGRPIPAPPVKVKMFSFTADDRLNTVHVNGPADVIAKARKVLEDLDKGTTPVLNGDPFMKVYPTAPGTSETIAKSLSEIYKPTQNLRIAALSPNQVMVWGNAQDQFDIAKSIVGINPAEDTVTKYRSLATLDAAKVAAQLKLAFSDQAKGGPFIGEDERNGIVIKGTADQVQKVIDFIDVLEPRSGSGNEGMRRATITIKEGNAVNVAETVLKMMQEMGYQPKLIKPGFEEPAAPPKKDEKKEEPPKDKTFVPPPLLDTKLTAVSASQPLVDPRDKKAEIKVTAVGNRLSIESDDPDAVAKFSEIVRLIVAPGGEGDFNVIRLKRANAAEVARILDQWFNGTKPEGQQGRSQSPFGGGGFPSPFGGGGGGRQETTTPEKLRVRIVADPGTNSLLIRASAVDMMTIQSMLKSILDSGIEDSEALAKTNIIKLQNASAIDVFQVCQDVFREYTNQSASLSPGGSSGGFSFFGGPFGGGASGQRSQPLDASGRPKQVQLTMAVDDRSNSLIVNAPQKIFDSVNMLAMELDKAAAESARTVKVVKVTNVDPVLVQQAIDAIQGRRTGMTSTSTRGQQGGLNRGGSNTGSPFGGSSPFGGGGQSPFGGGGGFSPFGGGGFSPGGGGSPGGGRGSRGGGGSRPSDGDERGPGFFESRGTDSPQRTLIYDPRTDPRVVQARHAGVQLAAHQQPKDEPKKDEPKKDSAKKDGTEDIRGPRSTVIVEALEEIGVVIISANNQADLEEAMKILRVIEEISKEAEPTIHIQALEHGDATAITNILNQVLTRIQVVPGGNVLTPAPAQGQGLGQGRTGTGGGLGNILGGLQQGGIQGGQQQSSTGSILMLPLPRFNSILIGAPKSRLDYVIAEIKKLDRPNAQQGAAHAFPLKKASAQIVAGQLTQFYAQRYSPGESSQQNQVRFAFDVSTNTVLVQAGPADLEEIRGLIERIDNTVSDAVNDLKVVRLRNAFADELAQTLLQALISGVATQSIGTTGGTGGGGLGGGGLGGALGGGGFGQQGGAGGGGFGQQGGLGGGGLGGQGGIGRTGSQTSTNGITTKTTTLRLIRGDGQNAIQSGFLEDVHLTADVRTNSLIIAAKPETMSLILGLIEKLDVTAAARAQINVFTLKKADAVLTANLIQQLFQGSRTGTTGATGGAGGALGGGAQGGGGLGGQQGGLGGGTSQQGIRPLLTLSGFTSDGATLIDLRISVDERTNSILVAGSQNDLDTIAAIISRLEDADIKPRINEVIKLRNAAAADVVNALQGFLTNSLAVIQTGNQLTGFQEIRQAVVLAPEPITNSILISASQEWYPRVLQLIQGLDQRPMQVAVNCLIAEVRLSNTEEFGVELGLQSPILFNRGLIGTTGTVGLTNTTGSLIPAGVSVTQATNITAVPGLNFNNTQAINGGLPQFNLASPSTVAFQGLGSLGVGRANASGIGGFVFSGASDTVNVLIRALKTQGRIDILNAPNLQTLDNQIGFVTVGQIFPYITGGQFTALGTFQPNITYRTDVGVTLQVTPRISPEGRILMRVEPSVIQPLDTQVPLGNGLFATAFSNQVVQTTVLAEDGETVVIGGLITKNSTRQENKIPFFGDLPYVGAAFRYRTQAMEKRELIIVLTPRIIRTPEDADRFAIDRFKQMDWNLKDVEKAYGKENMSLIRPNPNGSNVAPYCPPAEQEQFLPADPSLPAPKPVSKGEPQGPELKQASHTVGTDAPKQKESRGWSLFGNSK